MEAIYRVFRCQVYENYCQMVPIFGIKQAIPNGNWQFNRQVKPNRIAQRHVILSAVKNPFGSNFFNGLLTESKPQRDVSLRSTKQVKVNDDAARAAAPSRRCQRR